METYTWEWIVANWSIVSAGLIAGLTALATLKSALKSIKEPIMGFIGKGQDTAQEALNAAQEKWQNKTDELNIQDKIVNLTIKIKSNVLDGEALTYAKEQLKLLEDAKSQL